MMNGIQQDTDLWEVWIEYDQFHPEYFGTLYVHGEISTDKRITSSFIKMGTGEECQLNLQLPPGATRIHCTEEVMYSEPIKNLNQYTSVCIYAGEELIGLFTDIEIMI
jgi:hypothetical protein